MTGGLMRLHLTLVRVIAVAMIGVLTLTFTLATPRSEVQAQDYLAQLGTAFGAWSGPYADFAEKGEEIVEDFTVIFDMAWMAEWQGDLAAFNDVAAALGAMSLPSDADSTLAALIAEIAADVPGQTEAAQDGMDDIAGDAGASLTAAYTALGATAAKVAEAAALVQAAGGTVEPSSTGNAGLIGESSTSAATLALLALFAIALVGGARLATERTRRS